MGQKKLATTEGDNVTAPKKTDVVAPKKSIKKQILRGTVYISSSYNNTLISVADPNGNVFAFSSSGMMGFKGARKSTPYAATIVGKDAIEKGKKFGFQEAKICVRGIGPGREAAIRGIAASGINVVSIIDATPMAHNGVRPKKPRRI